MREYDTYKPTKIEFLDVIPEHWEEKRMRFYGYLYGGLSGKSALDFNQLTNEENKYFIPFTNIANNFRIDPESLQTVVISENENQNKVQKGDLFFLMSSENYDDVGKTAVLKDDLEETYLNSFCKGFRITKEKIVPEFLNYQLHSKQLRHNLLTGANGFTRINLKIDKVIDLLTAIPTPEEQIAIADYLDRKTAVIDELIADKKRLLELYEEEKTAIINQAVTKGINTDAPMRDSGIELLGEIPEHWEVKRIRHVAQIFGRIGYRGYKTTDLVQKGEGAITISPSNMKGYYMDFSDCSYLSWEKYEESPEIMIHNGDILFVKTGSTYGKSSLVENLPEKATINPQIIVLKEIQCNNKLLWYIIKSEYTQFQVEGTVVGGTIPTISQAKINNYEFVLTSDSAEQQSIVDFIDMECARIDAKKAKTEKLIELLIEYRIALISEVVTGKIKVIE